MGKDELLKTLETEAYNFDYLRSVFTNVYVDQPVITIDTTISPVENAKKIMNVIVDYNVAK